MCRVQAGQTCFGRSSAAGCHQGWKSCAVRPGKNTLDNDEDLSEDALPLWRGHIAPQFRRRSAQSVPMVRFDVRAVCGAVPFPYHGTAGPHPSRYCGRHRAGRLAKVSGRHAQGRPPGGPRVAFGHALLPAVERVHQPTARLSLWSRVGGRSSLFKLPVQRLCS